MATLVGEELTPVKMLEHLISLDYDAIEAYESAIELISNEVHKGWLESFKTDHERHTRELEPIVLQLGGRPPKGPGVKSMLTTGKVEMASLSGGGDSAILGAMLSNEDDTNTAYEKVLTRAPDEALEVVRRGCDDERRHKAWIESTLEAMK